MITLDRLKKLHPCQDRLDNYIEHYGDKNFTIDEFLSLEKITHSDKVWVSFRLMPKENIRLVAGEIAKSVLHIFEEKYPNDDRPRKAVEMALGNYSADAGYDAAYAAAYAADAAAYAADAARAAYAARAAAYAADAARAAYAARAAAYAARAAYAAAAAAAGVLNQEEINLNIIRKYWKE